MMSITWSELPQSLNDKLSSMFHKKDLFLEYNPGKCILTKVFKDISQEILDFEVKRDDVWLISYPRTGSTWCQEMVWLLGNNLDYEKARSLPQYARAPVLEMLSFFPDEAKEAFKGELEKVLDWARNLPSPRFIKSHLPYQFLPTKMHTIKPKIIFPVRNTKDVSVSLYHHMKVLHGMDTSFQDFVETFLDGVFPLGSYWEYLAHYSKIVNQPNVLVISYEEMKKDFKATIRKTAKFLEKDISEEQVEDLSQFLSFDNMKTNRAVNFEPILEQIRRKEDSHIRFCRTGKIGDWKNYMTPEISKRFDELDEKYSEFELIRMVSDFK